MSVVQDLKSVVRDLSQNNGSIELIEEYNSAITVIECRVLITSCDFSHVITDMCAVVELETESDNPNQKKIDAYNNAISKLEKASGL